MTDLVVDELKREDVARSHLNYTATEMTRFVVQVCDSVGLKRVFFCGGLCAHPFVRRVMTQAFTASLLSQMAVAEVGPIIVSPKSIVNKYIGLNPNIKHTLVILLMRTSCLELANYFSSHFAQTRLITIAHRGWCSATGTTPN